MTSLTRRGFLKTSGALGALLFLPASKLMAQQNLQFTPLQLNGGGRRQLDPRLHALEQHEEHLLDDLLATDFRAEDRDLRLLDRDIDGLIAQPGNPYNYAAQDFRFEAGRVHDRLYDAYHGQHYDQGAIFGCVNSLDSFVTHWYPCHSIHGIGQCQRTVWNCLSSPRGCRRAALYCHHIRCDLDAFFRFHRVGGGFGPHTGQLLNVFDQAVVGIRRGQFRTARVGFQRFTMATDLIFRKYYPRWC